MKRLKRYLAVFLTALMVITSFPLSALAEEIHTDASGMTDSVSWNYDSKTDTLYINTINGNKKLCHDNFAVYDRGYLPTYFSQEDQDNKELVWDSSFVSNIIIGKDVEIMENLLLGDFSSDKCDSGYYNLKSVTFEKGSRLKKIGMDVFSCLSIASIDLPYGLEIIDWFAFESAQLKEIVIPDTVYEIGDCAFECAELERVTLPSYKGDKEIVFGSSIFGGCNNLTDIDFGTTITTIPSGMFSDCAALTSITIPDTITAIDEYAFYYSKLEKIVLPRNLKSIGGSAFRECTNLTDVDFSRVKGSVSIGDICFYECSSLTSINIPTAVSEIGERCFNKSGLTSFKCNSTIDEICSYAFSDCSTLKDINIKNVRKIGDYAFENTGLTEVEFSPKLEEIGQHAFIGTGIKKLDLTDTNVINIPDNAFCGEANLEEIDLPDNLNTIGECALSGTGIEELTIPASVTSLGSSFCSNCPELFEVVMSEYSSLSAIPSWAFYNCPQLGDVYVIDSIKTIGANAFAKCTNLQWIWYYESQLESIGRCAFSGCGYLNEFIFPETIKTIGEYAFSGCDSITEVDLSKCNAIEEIGTGAFQNTTYLTTFKFPKKKAVAIPEGMLMGSGVTSLTIPTATSIGRDAFNGIKIKSLTLPDNCKTISRDAFANCTNLEYVRMPYAYAPNRIYNPFTNSTNIKTMIYPSRNSFTYDERLYSNNGFLAWEGLTVFCYEDTDIQKYCEKHNISYGILEEEIENNINGNSTIPFSKQGTCENGTWRLYEKGGYSSGYTLEILVDGDIKDDAIVCDSGRIATFKELARAYHICYIEFGEGVTSIPDNFFYSPEKAIYAFDYGLKFPSTLKSIGKNAFRKLWNLTKVIIPDNVTEIGEYAFADSLQLHEVKIGDGITEIKEGTFYASNPITHKLPANLKSIGKKAFAGITKTGDVTKNMIKFSIPESVEFIYNDPAHPENNAFGFDKFGVVHSDKVSFKVHYGSVGYKYVKQYCLDYVLLSGEETEEEKNYVPEINYRDVKWGYLSSESTIKDHGIDYSKVKWVYNEFDKTLTITGGGFYKNIGTLGFFRADKTQVKQGDLDVETIIINNMNNISASAKDPLLNLSMFNPKYIIVDDSCTQIQNNAFKDCTNLESFTFPDSVTNIDGTIFTNCTSLRAVKFGKGIKNISANILKYNPQLEYVTISEGCTSIGSGAFRNCNNLHEIVIPDSVKSIGSYAFYKDLGINKVTLGKGVNIVGNKAFYGLLFCQKLNVNSDLFVNDNDAKIAKNEPFGMFGGSTTGVEVSFGDTATVNLLGFLNANVSEISLSENVTGVKNITALPKLEKITVDENNQQFHTYDNALYSNDGTLVLAPKNASAVTIEDGTTAIGANAFSNSSLKSVTIPDSVKTIGDYAFAESENLKSVQFGDGVEAIGDYSFKNCSKIKFLYFHEALKSIGSGAFEGNTDLASVIFNEGITSIGNDSFAYCGGLKDVVISESVESIGGRAFADCGSLERLYIFNSEIESTILSSSDNAKIYTMAGSVPYERAREYNIPYYAYTDEDCFYDDVAVKLDSLAGYLGYCENGHGDIQYLTVYEPSCTQDGFIIGVCEYCSVILEEQHISACGHNYVNSVSIPATERTNGIDKYKCTNCNDTYTVYSPALDSEKAENTMCNITGSVVIANDKEATQGTAALSAVDISLGGETLATTDKNGEFSFSLETGSYELVLHYNYGFDRTVYLVVTDEDIDMGAIPIIACDWNKDGVIDDDDYTLFRFVVGSTSDSPSYLSFVDMNNDGKINVKDLVYMNNVKGIDSSDFEYPNIVIGV